MDESTCGRAARCTASAPRASRVSRDRQWSATFQKAQFPVPRESLGEGAEAVCLAERSTALAVTQVAVKIAFDDETAPGPRKHKAFAAFKIMNVLCSDEASYITGTNTDAGWRIHTDDMRSRGAAQHITAADAASPSG